MKFSRDAAISRIPAPHVRKQGQLQLADASFRDYPGKRPQTVRVRSIRRTSRDLDVLGSREDGGDEAGDRGDGGGECGRVKVRVTVRVRMSESENESESESESGSGSENELVSK